LLMISSVSPIASASAVNVQYQPTARAIYGTKTEPRNEKHIRSLAIHFQNWCGKKHNEIKIVLFPFEVISAYLNMC
jgi:hypothetical protein